MVEGPTKYRFPKGMRPASVRERAEFYRREFSVEKMRRWFQGWNFPIVFAGVIGRHTRIYPREYRKERKKTILIDEYKNLDDLEKYLIEFRPESAYHDRNLYRNWDQVRKVDGNTERLGDEFGQQLPLDIDSENFDCPIHGSLDQKMVKHQGLSWKMTLVE